jgi:hypothetical protein
MLTVPLRLREMISPVCYNINPETNTSLCVAIYAVRCLFSLSVGLSKTCATCRIEKRQGEVANKRCNLKISKTTDMMLPGVSLVCRRAVLRRFYAGLL